MRLKETMAAQVSMPAVTHFILNNLEKNTASAKVLAAWPDTNP